MENAVTTVVIKQLVFTYRGAIVKLVFCVMVRVTVHGLPQAWATGEGHLPSPRKCTSLDSLHFDSHKKNQNRCHSHQISSLINQRLVALSLSLTINTSVDNSWSDFQSDHTWSLVFWKYTVFQKHVTTSPAITWTRIVRLQQWHTYYWALPISWTYFTLRNCRVLNICKNINKLMKIS